MNAPAFIGAAHAVYAPSAAHRWAMEGGCSASAEAIAHLGELEEGEEAIEGTEAHNEIERILGQFNGTIAEPAAIREAAARLIDLDHPAAYGVALIIDYVARLPRGRVWIEQRVRLTNEIWGRADVQHWHEESFTLTVPDYKNGHVGVDAAENAQLRIYAAASIYTHNLAVKWIRYAVVQPNDFRPVPRVKQWYESAQSLFDFAQRVAVIPHGPKRFVAGEQCTYCPLFGRCPASRDVLRDVAALVAGLMTPDQVSPAQRALFLACKKPIADAFKNAEKVWAKLQLSGSGAVELKMVTSQTHRAWDNPVTARAAVVAKLGVDALELPSPAQAIERGMDEATVNAMASRPAGAPVLAFANDRRPNWEPKTVASMFGAAVRGMAQ